MRATLTRTVIVLIVCCVLLAASAGAASPVPVHSDKANVVSFPAQEARFVRFVIHATNSGSQPCIDELEVFGPDGKANLALAAKGAKASASSCLAGHAIHTVEHLNDGLYGNDHSWIAAGAADEWVQMELPRVARISRVVFSRDRGRHFADRVPVRFSVCLSSDGRQWKTVSEVSTTAAQVALRPKTGAFSIAVPPPPPPPRNAGGSAATGAGQAGLHAPAKDELGFANLALQPGAKARASSVIKGFAIHRIEHLNDGIGGNDNSWVSGGEPSWVEIDLGEVYQVYKVAFASDNSGRYNDRAATRFDISTTTAQEADGAWRVVWKHAGAPVHLRSEFRFKPSKARRVRIRVESTNANAVRIDEVEVYGQKAPIPLASIGKLPEPKSADEADVQEMLRYAFLGEEHAWLKTFGRADLSSRLVPYNGRVKEYPRHVGDDRTTLPPLPAAPRCDGALDDECWKSASRAAVRVAYPYDFDAGPLVTCELLAGRYRGSLCLAVRTNRLLSSHLAVVSAAGGEGGGVVAIGEGGLVFNTYEAEGRSVKLGESRPVEGAFDAKLGCFEFILPLRWFPGCEQGGLRVGLGMGGRHADRAGRAVHLLPSPLCIAEASACTGGTFRVRVALADGAEATRLSCNAPSVRDAFSLKPGESRLLTIAARDGPIGPELDLRLAENGTDEYALHLFRYDPLKRVLDQWRELAARLAAKGVSVKNDVEQIERFEQTRARLMSLAYRDVEAEREAFFEARLAKRKLFMREPDLAPIEKILFVKRRPFEPSHNYSDYFDAPFRPGGGIYVLRIPFEDGQCCPDHAVTTRLFDSGGGIARNPAADFDLSTIYFGYRPSADGYYHLMRMNADGSGLEQITEGPFHDFFPCVLPDGGIAFVSTRCKCRALCWRPQVSVLFRMDRDGRNMRALSLANLTEWAPSVMSDGRIIWTRWEYLDKGADFGHTLWSIFPDGTHPELVFGNTIIQPNGYANGREVPGTGEICCTLISHFGDLNGPIALLDLEKGRFNPKAIRSITPEVPWPGNWPRNECFRDPVPIARDHILCSHAPRDRFGIYVIDRYGNRELVYLDSSISSMCPTPFRKTAEPPVARGVWSADEECGEFVLTDVYRGLSPPVERGAVKYVRVMEEVRSGIPLMPDGQYRKDHPDFMEWYATPVHRVSGPYGWPTYVAKASHGIVPVEEDGSARFSAPAGRTIYFQVLDADLNELQRMRSVMQLQPGERRSCIGCHESRSMAPPNPRGIMARRTRALDPPPWGTGPLSYEAVVQPVLDRNCVRCHHRNHPMKLDLSGELDADKVPASYRTLVSRGLVHYADCGYNSGGCEKLQPMSFGVFKSRLWKVLDSGHKGVELSRDEMRAIKTWIDMNCPLWPDYIHRSRRPAARK